LHHARRLDDLLLALDRARPGDEDEVVAAARDVPDRDGLVERPVGRPLLRDPLVRAPDRDQLLDASELRDLADRELRDVAVDADQRDLLADHLSGVEAEAVELLLDRGNLLAGRVPAHLDEHRASPSAAAWPAGGHCTRSSGDASRGRRTAGRRARRGNDGRARAPRRPGRGAPPGTLPGGPPRPPPPRPRRAPP